MLLQHKQLIFKNKTAFYNKNIWKIPPSIVCEVNEVFENILHLLHLYEGHGVLYDGLHQSHQEQDGYHPLVGQVCVWHFLIPNPLQ